MLTYGVLVVLSYTVLVVVSYTLLVVEASAGLVCCHLVVLPSACQCVGT